MGNNNSKWSDYKKQEQIEIVKDLIKSAQAACDELLAKIETGDIEEISEPDYAVRREFTSGTNYENPQFSFEVSLNIKGLVKKEIKEHNFWPKENNQQVENIVENAML